MAIDSDDLFIDTRDERIVLAKLLDIPGLGHSGIERSPRLGLTKVTLTGVTTAVARLRADAGPQTSAAMVAQFGVDDHTLIDMDVPIAVVREWARTTFPNWRPVIDRDHDDGPVESNPHHKISIGPPVEEPAEPSTRVPPGEPVGPSVGIADTQIYAHDDLAGRYLGRPLTGDGPFPSGTSGHATFVAGTVLSRCPSALLVARRVLVRKQLDVDREQSDVDTEQSVVPREQSDVDTEQSDRSWDVANRLMGFLDDDIDVLNMSFGCKAEGGEPLPMRRAMDVLGQRTVLVAAVGNHAQEDGNRPLYPAAFGNVLAVGAAEAVRGSALATDAGELADTTPDVPWLDLVAPGVNQVGPYLVGKVNAGPGIVGSKPARFASGYVKWSGSSFAAAAASGAIAELMVELRIDAFAARDVLLKDGNGKVQPFAFDLRGQGLRS